MNVAQFTAWTIQTIVNMDLFLWTIWTFVNVDRLDNLDLTICLASSHDIMSIYPTRSAVQMRNAQCACQLPGHMYETNAEHFSQTDRESGVECSAH